MNNEAIRRHPQHIAIIMDGNGRWAIQKKKSRFSGYNQGINAVQRTIKACINQDIPFLTLFAFSSENWRRSREEITFLMNLMLQVIKKELANLAEKGIKLTIIGDKKKLPQKVQRAIQAAEKKTINGKRLHLFLAISYGGRWDIVQAAKKLAYNVLEQNICVHDINEVRFSQNLSTGYYPDPDLLIRTSGEMRVSNFLLWQLAYAELYFCPILWPDFTEMHLQQALDFYSTRKRRFGQSNL